jgi:hypothetical protein
MLRTPNWTRHGLQLDAMSILHLNLRSQIALGKQSVANTRVMKESSNEDEQRISRPQINTDENGSGIETWIRIRAPIPDPFSSVFICGR